MKSPILNHVALTVPRTLVSDTQERRNLLEFFESVFGWRAIELMTIDGERLKLFKVSADVPLTTNHDKNEVRVHVQAGSRLISHGS